MTGRDKLQLCYELAFFPPRLNNFWARVKSGEVTATAEVVELLDIALRLHQVLPEGGYASQRALRRLACYQADARAFNMPRFLRNIRTSLGCPPFLPGPVPGNLVRDIGLPALSHHPASEQPQKG